jgi:adenylate kinase
MADPGSAALPLGWWGVPLAVLASLVSGAPMSFIHNHEGKSDEAASQIAALVRGAKA